MGNLIARITTPRQKADLFIIRHAKEWPVIVNKIKLGRKLNEQRYLDEANDILAPLIEEEGYGIGGEIEVARVLWSILRDDTTPPKEG